MSLFNNLSKLFNEQGSRGQAPARQGAKGKAPVKGRPQQGGKPGARSEVRIVRSTAGHAAPQAAQQSAQTGGRFAAPARAAVGQSVAPQQPAQNTQAVSDAEKKARDIIVSAKDEALAIQTEAEKKARQVERQLQDQQKFLESKLDKLDERLGSLDKKEQTLETEKEKLAKLRDDLEKAKESVAEKLQKVAKLSAADAKKQLMEALEQKMSAEMSQYIKQREEEAKQDADAKAAEIIIEAMKYGATDHVAEYTVSVVNIPSEEIKGKIIGKSGRNIHSFERATGVDVDLDAGPNEVKLSSFDPVRREIARVSLERLIKDGRIQPARIEEIVDKVTKEIEKIIFEAGRQLCHTVGVYNLPSELIAMLGRFKYRFSYGQNMITHTIEETKIGTKIAHELGLDVNVVKMGCLLHDIGKVAPEADDNHVALGVRIAKKYGLPQAVVDCIAQHHEDEPFSSAESMAVYVADAISGARPGARYENHEEYIKRLEDLEKIAMSYPEVKQAYAVQAGRELRVLLEPEQSKEDDVQVLAVKIRDEVQEKVMVPGSVNVTVIRETRADERTH